MKVKVIDIAKITVGTRHRKDLGDLDKLKASLEALGQLQSIGVDKKNNLVWGQRRLEAAKRAGWSTIEAKVFDLDEVLDAERDENDCRLDTTLSEKSSLAKALEEELKGREGRPKKGGQVATISGKSRDIAAKKAGFSSATQARRVAKVVENAEPEVVEQMDSGNMPVSVAEKVADLPVSRQRSIASDFANGKPEKAKKEIAKATKNGAPTFDDRPIGETLSKLARLFHERSKSHGGETKEYKDVRERWEDLNTAWKRWQLAKERR